MELKPIKNYKKIDVPTQKDSKSKLISFLIENKRLTLPLTLLFLITNMKNTLAMPQELMGDVPLTTPGVLEYEPTPFEHYFTIFESLAIPTILTTIITIFIYNIVSNKKYEKILNHDEEEIFNKKKRKSTIIIFITLFIIWLLTSFIIYMLT